MGRVQRPETGQGPAGRVPQREAAPGQQPETKLEAQVPAPSGGETGRGDGQLGQLRQRATGVESEDGQRPGRGDQGPEHLGATGPLEPEKPPEQIFGGKPHIKIKPKLPGELGATGPLEAEPIVEGGYAGKPHITLKPAKEGGFEPPKITTPEASKNIAAIPPPNYPLGGAETAVSNRMKRIVANVDSAEVAYAKLPDTDGGNIINTDSIREMSPDYASSVKARSRFSNAVQEPSSWLADQLYTRRLTKPVREGKDAKVFFTAGGPDSGKSVSLGSTEAQSADMIYDGNMNNLTKARRRIKMALDSGRSVDIQFHDRDPIKSFKSMLMRAMKLGRSVPVEAHAAANNDSFKTVQALSRQYGNDKRVRFHAIDVDTFKESTLDALAEKHYEVTPSQLHQIAAEEYRNGRITEAVFRGVSGKRAERLVGGREDHGRLPGVEVEARGAEQHPVVEAGKGAEGHVPGEEGHRGGAQEEDRLGEGVPGAVQVKPKFRVSEDRGGVRELSYDARFAAAHGLTEDEIRAQAGVKETGPKLSLRAGLLRFLGLRAEEPVKRVAKVPVSPEDRVRYRVGETAEDRASDLKRKRDEFPEFIKKSREDWERDQSQAITDEAARIAGRGIQYRTGAPDYHDAAFLSAERYDMTPEQNARRTVNLAAALRRAGLVPKEAAGLYTDENKVTSSEASFMVHPKTEAHVDAISALAKRFKQESVLYTHNGEAALHYTADGRIENKGFIREAGRREAEARTAYTRLADGRHLVTDEKPVVEDHTEADAKRRAKGFMTSVGDLPDTTPEEKAVIASGGMDHGELKEVVEHITKRFGVRVNISSGFLRLPLVTFQCLLG